MRRWSIKQQNMCVSLTLTDYERSVRLSIAGFLAVDGQLPMNVLLVTRGGILKFFGARNIDRACCGLVSFRFALYLSFVSILFELAESKLLDKNTHKHERNHGWSKAR